MTRREWMKENYPSYVYVKYGGGVCGCPNDYDDLPDNHVGRNECNNKSCEECWDKEMKE